MLILTTSDPDESTYRRADPGCGSLARTPAYTGAGSRADYPPMGAFAVKRVCWPVPVTSVWSSGWTVLGFFAAAGFRAAAPAGVTLERPQR